MAYPVGLDIVTDWTVEEMALAARWLISEGGPESF